jgi:hypothetical protein
MEELDWTEMLFGIVFLSAALLLHTRQTPHLYITQPVLVIPYRRFGTTYRSHLQGSSDFARTRCTPNSNLAEDLTPHVERPVC